MKIAYKNKIPESFKQSFNAGNPCTVRKMTEDWNKENLESALKKKTNKGKNCRIRDSVSYWGKITQIILKN